jgi:hypothetical protein
MAALLIGLLVDVRCAQSSRLRFSIFSLILAVIISFFGGKARPCGWPILARPEK